MTAELPVVRSVQGRLPGPTAVILGGVHGDEYEGVLAANVLAASLETLLDNGAVRIVAPAHPAAWRSGTRRSPTDDVDLARVFPGRPVGGVTEQVAHVLTERAIRGADVLVDLHSAGSGYEMPFVCGYHDDGDLLGARSSRIADAFAAHYTWCHEEAPAPGRSLTAALQLGIPAIYVEASGGKSVRADELSGYVSGVLRVLHLLGMVGESPPATRESLRVRGPGNTDAGMAATADGYLVTSRRVGDLVDEGEVIASVVDVGGSVLDHVVAPQPGLVMLLRRDARVSRGDTVCMVASPAGWVDRP
jgi:predicted deacylase